MRRFINLFISVRRSTCFRQFFRPSSGAQNCTYSVRHLSDRYCYLLPDICQTDTATCCLTSVRPILLPAAWHLSDRYCYLLPDICQTDTATCCPTSVRPILLLAAWYLSDRYCYLLPDICQTDTATCCLTSVRPILLLAAWHLSDRYCYLLLAAGSSIGLTNAWRSMCSFELLMMDGKTVWNM